MKYSLKWPNDVLAGRQKLAGILLEAEAVPVTGWPWWSASAPMSSPHRRARRQPATSLAALGVHIGAEELFAELSDAWAEFRGIWDDGRGFGEIRRLWLERAAGLGQPVAVQTGAASVEGIFDTIDEQGCLIVRKADGQRVPISAGDVYFGSAASAGAV